MSGAEPAERWVSSSCGRVDADGQQPQGVPHSSVRAGTHATHVLAMGWEPAFCEQHGDKSECRQLAPSNFASTHLSLHGLWPQPRGTQYCNVAPDVRDPPKRFRPRTVLSTRSYSLGAATSFRGRRCLTYQVRPELAIMTRLWRLLPTKPKMAPWGSVHWKIQQPSGTSIGPLMTWPPRSVTRFAASSTSLMLK